MGILYILPLFFLLQIDVLLTNLIAIFLLQLKLIQIEFLCSLCKLGRGKILRSKVSCHFFLPISSGKLIETLGAQGN